MQGVLAAGIGAEYSDGNKREGKWFQIKKGRFRLDVQKLFYNQGGEALAQVAQRGGGCPIPGDIQGQAGWGSEQSDEAIDVPVHCSGVGLDVPFYLK